MNGLKPMKLILAGFLFAILPYSIALAYVGPGVGITMIGGFWVVIAIILSAVGGLLVWPIKAFLRWKRGRFSKRNADADKG